MDVQSHWEKIYSEIAPDAVSWYRPHLEASLALIEQAAADCSASIIDVGGGESTLVDDLLARGHESITVLDVSQTAIDTNRKRLGEASERVHWLIADITKVDLEPAAYDVWHDRAVFHFLTAPDDRIAYVRQIAHAVKPGGHVIVSTFGPEGPKKCSGLDVVRYDAESPHKGIRCTFPFAAELQRPYTGHRLGQSSSFSIVIAGSNSKSVISLSFSSVHSRHSRYRFEVLSEQSLAPEGVVQA